MKLLNLYPPDTNFHVQTLLYQTVPLCLSTITVMCANISDTYHFLLLDMIRKVLCYDVSIRQQDIADGLRERNQRKE